MKAIGLIANATKDHAENAVTRVLAKGRELGFKLWCVPEGIAPWLPPGTLTCEAAELAGKGVEAVLVLGGDGTMLDASRLLSDHPLPLMGLNIGSLGYLTCVGETMFDEALRRLKEGNYTLSWRTTLSARILRRPGKNLLIPPALNDIVVSRGSSGTAVELDLSIDGQMVSRFLCDGLIVATPTGSTAYSLAAGGPIMMPDVDAVVVSPICPHTLTSRPLVVKGSSRLMITVVSARTSLIASADGRSNDWLNIGDSVRIEAGMKRVPVIVFKPYNPCDVMRKKLGWGGRQTPDQQR